METLVPPALAASAPERARAVQALLDAHGPEMDRRRELTPEVVDALAGQDLLAHAAAQEHGRAGNAAGRILQGLRGDRLGRCQRRLVRQSVQRLGRDVRRLHAARGGRRHVRRPARGPRLGRPAQQQQRRPGGGRLPPDRHLELRQRRPSHQMAGRPQRGAESRRHAAYPLRPAGRPQLPLPARARRRSSTTGTCSACAAPAATATRSRTCSCPTSTRRRATCRTSGARRARSTRSARPCSTPAASAA